MKKGDWLCWDNGYDKLTEEVGRDNTEANARAQMLIYLLEKKAPLAP